MPMFVVQQVIGSKQFNSSFGPMMCYTIDVDGDDGYQGTVEHNRKEGSQPPAVGETIDGHIEPGKGNFPPKLKKNFQQQGSGFQQAAAQAAPGQPPIAPSSPPVRPPQARPAPSRGNDQQDSIERQVAWKGAAEIVSALAGSGMPHTEVEGMVASVFNHGLALIQNTNVHSADEARQALERAAPQAGQPKPDPEQEIPLEDIRAGYAAWMERQQDPASAKMVWANKLTSLGLTEDRIAEAGLDERKMIRDFLNGT